MGSKKTILGGTVLGAGQIYVSFKPRLLSSCEIVGTLYFRSVRSSNHVRNVVHVVGQAVLSLGDQRWLDLLGDDGVAAVVVIIFLLEEPTRLEER